LVPDPVGDETAPTPSRQSLRGLDWFIFFLADVQTGFGPFISVYLTTQKWTQVEIGFVLSIGGLVGQVAPSSILPAPNGWWRASRLRQSAPARWDMRRGRSFR
jgi:hypothetical protein